jgi:hypothetical protein
MISMRLFRLHWRQRGKRRDKNGKRKDYYPLITRLQTIED